MKTEKIKIGLFGFGVVGQGFYELVKKRAPDKIDIIRIAVKNPKKERSLDQSAFTYDYKELLYSPDLELVVEATDDEKAGYEIIKTALLKGIPVVSANKKLLALHLEEFIALSKETNTPLLYEAAAAAAIPIITSLDAYFQHEPIKELRGIINGTTNYILSQMLAEGITFTEALKQAQDLGFAESNPKNDVDGFDAAYKLSLLSAHAFDQVVGHEDIIRYGIRFITAEDHLFAKNNNQVIKLVAHAFPSGDGIIGLVLPTLLNLEDELANVSAELNAVTVNAYDSGRHFFKGKGAGAFPTGSAILKDVFKALSGGYSYAKLKGNNSSNDIELELVLRYNSENCNANLDWLTKESAHKDSELIKEWIKLSALKLRITQLENEGIGILFTGKTRALIVDKADLSVIENNAFTKT